MNLKTQSIPVLLVAALLATAACGASEPAPSTPAPTPASGNSDSEASDASPVAMCNQLFVRQRECQAEFLPALVALRVRLDVPAGIAARDASEGREALLAGARTEYASDSTDEAIAATCDKIIATASDEEIDAFTPTMSECLAAQTCEALVSCSLSMLEDKLSRP